MPDQTAITRKKKSDRDARRFARLAMIAEQPSEYVEVNELALAWARSRIILFASLAIGLVGLCLIATSAASPRGGSPLILMLLFVRWMWSGAFMVRHYLTFKRKMDLNSRSEGFF